MSSPVQQSAAEFTGGAVFHVVHGEIAGEQTAINARLETADDRHGWVEIRLEGTGILDDTGSAYGEDSRVVLNVAVAQLDHVIAALTGIVAHARATGVIPAAE